MHTCRNLCNDTGTSIIVCFVSLLLWQRFPVSFFIKGCIYPVYCSLAHWDSLQVPISVIIDCFNILRILLVP